MWILWRVLAQRHWQQLRVQLHHTEVCWTTLFQLGPLVNRCDDVPNEGLLETVTLQGLSYYFRMTSGLQRGCNDSMDLFCSSVHLRTSYFNFCGGKPVKRRSNTYPLQHHWWKNREVPRFCTISLVENLSAQNRFILKFFDCPLVTPLISNSMSFLV